MPDIIEVPLPGVGVRHEFTTANGQRVAVVTHRSGRREIAVYRRDDPDACVNVLDLDADDAAALGTVLGAPHIAATLTAMQRLEGLGIDWLTVAGTSPPSGSTIGSGEYRTRTGASIVAVIRGDATHPAPGPEFTLAAGDIAGRGRDDRRHRATASPPARVTLLGATAGNAPVAFIELGAVAIVLAALARLAGRLGIPAIPFYLVAGLAVGEGGIAPLDVSADFISLAAQIGVLLLLLALGLEYTGDELRAGLRTGGPAGLADAPLNFVPGLACGLLLGWDLIPSLLLGGVCWISSSAVVAKIMDDLGWMANRETPAVLNLLVFEDLAMAIYLPVIGALVAGRAFGETAISVAAAMLAVAVIMTLALRYGHSLSRLLAGASDESLLLAVFGVTLLVGGLAEQVEVSAAIGAFLVGLALSGPVQQRAAALIDPLRDLFAATFFLFFSFQVHPSTLLDVALPATALAIVATGAKFASGWIACRPLGIGRVGRQRTGASLVAAW